MYIEITIPRIKKLLSLRHFSFVTLSQNATSLLRWRLTSFLLTRSVNHRGFILSPCSQTSSSHKSGRGWRPSTPRATTRFCTNNIPIRKQKERTNLQGQTSSVRATARFCINNISIRKQQACTHIAAFPGGGRWICRRQRRMRSFPREMYPLC